ncbi:unnamed protein product [Caenorhabditis sp. 36 PRJEB53466]|nr:unnamed protein product [Caenorhabditis sp. 36 PRJEB53466]
MNSFQTFAIIFLLFASVCAQQWTAQQMEAYRQQYYQWYYNQQRMQQAQATQAPAPVAQTPHPIWGNAQSDSKGNFWHGDDNAKLSLIARSSWP